MKRGDFVISFGDSGTNIKALGEGKFGGYLVRFSTEEDPDLVGDFFTKSTEFFIESGAVLPVLYDHGLNETLKRRKIGRSVVKFDDAGLWIDGELNLADEFEKALYDKMVVAGKAGLSSGAAAHMMSRKSVGNAKQILEWGLAEASLTPMPTEPRNYANALKSLKAYFETRYDPFADDEDAETVKHCTDKGYSMKPKKPKKAEDEEESEFECKCGEEFDSQEELDAHYEKAHKEDEDKAKSQRRKVMKSMFTEELANSREPSFYDLGYALCNVVKKIVKAAEVSNITGASVDIPGKISEAVDEYASQIKTTLNSQASTYLDGEGNYDSYISSSSSREFYVKSFMPEADPLHSYLSAKDALVSESKLDEHSARVVSAVGEYATLSASLGDGLKTWAKRCKDKIEFRAATKSSRLLAQVTIEKLNLTYKSLEEALASFKESHSQLGELLQIVNPPAESDQATEADMVEIELALARHRNSIAFTGF